ncbi:MAG: L-arabinose isomerase [Betaproteobacteria bacterium]
MPDLKKSEVWFVTGSQHLYGPETLAQVAENSRKIAGALDCSSRIPCRVVFKPVVKTPDEIHALLSEANGARDCVGLVLWMHTFSPAKMWIGGLMALQKPYLHLHTQFNRDLPWGSIDMDFMNLNQAAHGDREFGFICTRLRQNRKVVVGHWQDEEVHDRVGAWMRAACGWAETRRLKVARFGDNMREVAVTEGDKVAAQRQLGYSVNGYGVGDLVAFVNEVSEAEIRDLLGQYRAAYEIRASDAQQANLREQARVEAGLRAFLREGGFHAFTTTFEDLHGLGQLPGLAVQRLMAEGYGFGAEGDWKTAALVRAVKVMASGLPGGTSFMEDYTYHLDPRGPKVLGAHMLEVCPSIAAGRPALEVHPLGIGGKADPARLVFNVPAGPALNASLVDLGNRFRLIVNAVEVVEPDAKLPMLPTARAVWVPRPSLKVAAAAWIHAGGAHHTAFSQALGLEQLEDYAEMAGIEFVPIDEDTTVRRLKQELRWNEAYYLSTKGL